MAAGEEDKNKDGAKGFAGLSSLLSDVDTTLPPPAKKEMESAGASSSTERPATTTSQSAQSKPQAAKQQPYQAASQPSAGSSTGKWVLVIVAVMGVLWFISEANKKPPSYSASAPAYVPPAQNSLPSKPTVPEPTQTPSRLEEVKPPVGRDLAFSIAQIRYCLAEEIRMDSAKSVLDNYSDSEVDRFNAMIDDYNSRCSQFRYRSGALESARRDIETYRSELQADGKKRFSRSSSDGSLSSPAPTRPAPDVTVQAIQRKLNELGYDAGPADGLMGRGTRVAILAFQRDIGLSQDRQSVGNAQLLALLNLNASAAKAKSTARPDRINSLAQTAAHPSKPAPISLPSQPSSPTSASRDANNLRACVSGLYPSLCNHALLTPDEKALVAAAEKRANFQTCISGNYPSLCKRSLLTPEEAAQVTAAEKRTNLQICVSGNYPSLCKRSLLTPDQAEQVAAAERRVNYNNCVSGMYPSLCKHSLLTAAQTVQVAAAEKRVNFQACISGLYPSLCKHSLLTGDEAARVAEAERRARNR